VAGVFLAVFLVRFPPAAVSLRRLLEPGVAAAVVALASYAAGAAALAWARATFARFGGLTDDDGVADGASTLLIGAPVFGTLIAVLAWTGVAVALLASLAAIALAIAGAVALRKRRPPLPRVGAWDLVLLGPPVAMALVEAVSPVSSPDELVYKLAIPKAYLLFGGMIDLPLNSYSYVSTALSHLSLAALALSGGVAAKLAHAALFVAVLVTLRRLGEELRPGAGVWVAAVAAWTPALLLIAGLAWAEWGVLGLLLLSHRGWLAFQRRPTALGAAVITTALAGAAAIKYTALPWIAVFAVLAAARLARRADRSTGGSGRLLAPAALVMVALGGFFYLRNAIWTGSPVAPFLLDQAPVVSGYRSQGRLSGWQEVLLGYDIADRGIIDDALGALLPACAVVGLAGGWRERSLRDLVVVGLVPLPFLIAASPTSRLILASVLPLGVAGAVLLARSWAAIERGLLRAAAATVAATAMAAQLGLATFELLASNDPLDVVLGGERETAYDVRRRPYHAAYRWIEEKTPPASRVLLIGENRSYGLERPALSAGNLDGERLAAFLGRFADAPALASGLRGLGITHVVVHWPWLRVEGRATGPLDSIDREHVLPLPRATARVLQDLVDRVATRRYQDDRYSVYELPRDD
jgi:hypothetical protein